MKEKEGYILIDGKYIHIEDIDTIINVLKMQGEILLRQTVQTCPPDNHNKPMRKFRVTFKTDTFTANIELSANDFIQAIEFACKSLSLNQGFVWNVQTLE